MLQLTHEQELLGYPNVALRAPHQRPLPMSQRMKPSSTAPNMFQCTQELELLGCPNVYGPGLAGVASGDLFRRLKLDFSACVDVEYVTRDLLPSWQGLRYCRGPF